MLFRSHWGTFWPSGMSRWRAERFHSPGTAFSEAATLTTPEVRIHVLRPGEARALDGDR